MAVSRRSDIDIASLVRHYDSKRPLDWPEHFQRTGPLAVEIGSGLGEFLLQTAGQNPDWNLVGIEQEWERVKKTLRKIQLLKQSAAGQAFTNNIRVLHVDATVALERLFPLKSISRTFCLFPCPWPKKGHIKHRLFSQSFLCLLNSRLQQGGELLLVTDFHPYYEWVLEQLPGTGFEAVPRTVSPRFDTKYERKWLAQGQEKFFEIRLQKIFHSEIPLKKDDDLKVHFVEHFDPQQFRFTDLVSEATVVMKEIVFDPRAQKALLRFIVSEKTITQHLWVAVSRCQQGWRVAKADGLAVIPTEGLAMAIEYICQQIKQSCSSPPEASTGITIAES